MRSKLMLENQLLIIEKPLVKKQSLTSFIKSKLVELDNMQGIIHN